MSAAEELYMPEMYPAGMGLDIEKKGQITVQTANRWMLGWPERVKTLLANGTYKTVLLEYVDQEKDAYADAADLGHLSRAEIREVYGLRESPPDAG